MRVDAADEHSTALMYACRDGKRGIARLLLDFGADVNSTNSVGNTAFIWAASYGRIEIANLLLDHVANISVLGCDDALGGPA